MKTRRWTWLALGACVLGHLGLTIAGCTVAQPKAAPTTELSIEPQFRDAFLRARELHRQHKYAEALAIVENEVLSVDPQNEVGLIYRRVLIDAQEFIDYPVHSRLDDQSPLEHRLSSADTVSNVGKGMRD